MKKELQVFGLKVLTAEEVIDLISKNRKNNTEVVGWDKNKTDKVKELLDAFLMKYDDPEEMRKPLEALIQAARDDTREKEWKMVEEVMGDDGMVTIERMITLPWVWWVSGHGNADGPREAFVKAIEELHVFVEKEEK